MVKKQCESLNTRPRVRCELEDGHAGPHYAQISEVSEVMWNSKPTEKK